VPTSPLSSAAADPRANPFAPNAGAPPPALVGRDAELVAVEILLERLRRGYAEQSMLVTGLRGVGKRRRRRGARSCAAAPACCAPSR
jgi:Cdc6-like AAA superfamily ATPase